MSIKHWIQAARPFSNINLIFPLLLGQALAFRLHAHFNWTTCVLILLYGWIDQMYIVFINDAVDFEGDMINTNPTLFSGGSRVIPEGKLTSKALYIAGGINCVLVLLLGIILTFKNACYFLLPLFVAGLILLWMYSCFPFKMNYRGGGELLQGIGCGMLLPLIGYYAQAGTFDAFPWLFSIGFLCIHTSSSIATTLGDYDADQQSGKKTSAVSFGLLPAALLSLIIIITGIIVCYTQLRANSLVSITLTVFAPLIICVGALFTIQRLDKHCAVTLFGASIIGITLLCALGYTIQCFT